MEKNSVVNSSVSDEIHAHVPNSPSVVQRHRKERGKDKMTPMEKFRKASDFLKEMASFLSTCGEKEFLIKSDHLKHLKEQWMRNETVLEQPQAVDDVNESNEQNENETMSNELNEDVPEIERNAENNNVPEASVDEATDNRLEETVEDQIENNDTIKINIVNIPVVKTRVGRPRGSTKPFWQLSQEKTN